MTAVIDFIQKHKLLLFVAFLLILLIILNGFFKLVTIPGFIALLRKLDAERKTRKEYHKAVQPIKQDIIKQQSKNHELRGNYQKEKEDYSRDLRTLTQKRQDLNQLPTAEITSRVVKELEKKGLL